MIEAMHIVDNLARPDMLEQLDMLAGANERVISVGPPPTDMTRPVEIARCTMGSARLAGWSMRKLPGSEGIIHAWSPKAMLAGRELALATGRALVASIPAPPTTREELNALAKAVGPGLLNVVVPTDSARRRLIARGLPERFCHTLEPAARAWPAADEARGEIRKALNVADGARLLVSPAPFVRDAGHEYASWAHAILRHVPLNLRLAFTSTGPLEDHVRFFAHTTGFDEEVHFTHGRLPAAKVLAAADMAVFPQTRDIGVLAIASAMAAGLPILATNLAPIAELTGNGQAAELTEPGPRETSAGLLKLTDDDDLSRRLGQAAANRTAKMLDPGIVKEKLQAIYSAALETKAHGAR